VLNNYTFDMGDCEDGDCSSVSRSFMWVLGPINASHFEPASKMMKYIKAQQREMQIAASEKKAANSHSKFGTPPSANSDF
jgi:hypothetical protein